MTGLYEDEHEDFRKTARAFFEREVVPHHEQWEADGIVPRRSAVSGGACRTSAAGRGAGVTDMVFAP